MINVAGLSPHNQLVFAIWCIRQTIMLRGEVNERTLFACDVTDKFVNGETSRKELVQAWGLTWNYTRIWSGLWNMLWTILQLDPHVAAAYASEAVIGFAVHSKRIEGADRNIVSICRAIDDWCIRKEQTYQLQQKRIDELLLCNN
jgi:hypothetical protein